MQIDLQNIIPQYIDSNHIDRSEVWNRTVVISPGEHLHIVAPSGTGKTSLISFIYGLRTDYSGEIRYDGQNVKTLSTERFSSLRRTDISIIFQDLQLFPDETARQNVEIKRMLKPYHPPEKIDDMARRLGISGKLDQPVKTCSYGEQQRIAIIRSLMQPFHYLLLDEPYSHLDEANRANAMQLLYEECEQRGAAMIFADLKPLELLKGERVLML